MMTLPDLDHLNVADKDELIRALFAQVQFLTGQVTELSVQVTSLSAKVVELEGRLALSCGFSRHIRRAISATKPKQSSDHHLDSQSYSDHVECHLHSLSSFKPK